MQMRSYAAGVTEGEMLPHLNTCLSLGKGKTDCLQHKVIQFWTSHSVPNAHKDKDIIFLFNIFSYHKNDVVIFWPNIINEEALSFNYALYIIINQVFIVCNGKVFQLKFFWSEKPRNSELKRCPMQYFN